MVSLRAFRFYEVQNKVIFGYSLHEKRQHFFKIRSHAAYSQELMIRFEGRSFSKSGDTISIL